MLTIPGIDIGATLTVDDVRGVYRGVRQSDGKPVVVKVLLAAYPSQRDIGRLHHEQEIGQILGACAGIVQVYGTRPVGNGLALVVEDFGGYALSDLVAKGPLPLADFLDIAIQLADAVGHVHTHNVIHKDIKPANVIVDPKTLTAKLTDFGIAIAVPEETSEKLNPEELEGTLAYMAPEQTGRFGAPTDYRSDFYALGVTLYEMLAGVLPFTELDANALIHVHISKQPPALSQHGVTVPQVLERIILKCLAKAPAERYQSAYGIRHDLARAQHALRANGAVGDFSIGQGDASAKLRLSGTLFGRDADLHLLAAAVKRVWDGMSELVIVRGAPGIGKTAMGVGLHALATQTTCLFGRGKYSAATQRTPYTAIARICRGWVQEILLGDQQGISAWSETLRAALGDGAHALCALIPELELVIGVPPLVADLPSLEAQRRFFGAFRGLLRCMARERCVVMFLDDLQWADAGSLHLLARLLEPGACPRLLIVATRRDDNAVVAAPDAPAIDDFVHMLTKAEVTLSQTALGPLTRDAVVSLVADALGEGSEQVASLGSAVYEKTLGNPFFVRQLVEGLHRRNLLQFDHHRGLWRWNADALRDVPVTDNVVHLLAAQLQSLSSRAASAIKTAACIGPEFDLAALSAARTVSPDDAYDEIWETVEQGLIVPVGDGYKRLQNRVGGSLGHAEVEAKQARFRFVHSRVQQAAYDLLTHEARELTHLALARVLLGGRSIDALADDVFVIANHFQQAANLLQAGAERLLLCKLMRRAGARAKAAAAFADAKQYLEAARALMPASLWETDYALAFGMHYDLGECAYAVGEGAVALIAFEVALEHAQHRLQRATVMAAQMRVHAALGSYERAIDTGMRTLAEIGVTVPRQPTAIAMTLALARCRLAFMRSRRSIEDLATLPVNTDPENELLMMTLVYIIISANNAGNLSLYAWGTLRAFELTLKHGLSSASAVGFLGYGMTAALGGDNYAAGLRFMRLGLRSLERSHNDDLRIVTLAAHCICMWHWEHPVRDVLSALEEVQGAASSAGNLTWAGYAYFHRTSAMLYVGETLERVQAFLQQNIAFAQKNSYPDMPVLEQHRQFIAVMLAQESPEAFLDTPNRPAYSHDGARRFHLVLRLRYLVLMGDYTGAVRAASLNHRAMELYRGLLIHVEHTFFFALALVAGVPQGGWVGWSRRRQVKRLVARLVLWGQVNPQNFLAKSLIVQAEMRRVRGDYVEALGLYDAAVTAAEEHGCVQDIALANELAARACMNQDNLRLAKLYLTEARYHYRRWGALAKIRQLEAAYPNLVFDANAGNPVFDAAEAPTLRAPRPVRSVGLEGSDVHALLTSGRSIAAEMERSALLVKVVRIAIENAGAERGCLVLKQKSGWTVEAVGAANRDDVGVLEHVAVESYRDIPNALVHYVGNTGETVLLSDAAQSGAFQLDPYIKRVGAKSVLCAPIRQNNDIMGVLYLENNMLTGAFTEGGMALMNHLFAQAAVSLENARLYANLQAQVAARGDDLRNVTRKVAVLEKENAEHRMAGGFAHEIRNALAGSQLVLSKCAGTMGGRDEKSLWDQTSDDLATILGNLRAWLPAPAFDKITGYAKAIITNERKIADIVTHVTKNNERALAITLQIMEYARAGEVRGGAHTVDINGLVRKLVDQARVDFARDDIDVRFAATGQGSIEGNEMELFSVMRNLLRNARDAVLEAPERAHVIHVESSGTSDEVIITVRDNGVGIAAEHLPHIFDAFYKMRPEHGPGLGLSMVKKIVTMYGGDIVVRSAPGEESVFTVRLPRARSSEPPAPK